MYCLATEIPFLCLRGADKTKRKDVPPFFSLHATRERVCARQRKVSKMRGHKIKYFEVCQVTAAHGAYINAAFSVGHLTPSPFNSFEGIGFPEELKVQPSRLQSCFIAIILLVCFFFLFFSRFVFWMCAFCNSFLSRNNLNRFRRDDANDDRVPTSEYLPYPFLPFNSIYFPRSQIFLWCAAIWRVVTAHAWKPQT